MGCVNIRALNANRVHTLTQFISVFIRIGLSVVVVIVVAGGGHYVHQVAVLPLVR